MRALALFAVLALAVEGMGCASENKVTEEDRVLIEYDLEILSLMKPVVEAMATGMPLHASAMWSLYGDLAKNADTRRKNWGRPKESPPPYSPENAEAARKASEKSHSLAWWQIAGGTIVAGLGLLLSVGKHVARFIPGIGQWVTLSESVIGGAERYMAKAKAEGKPELADALVDEMLRLQEGNPAVKSLAEKALATVKKKLGIADVEPPPPPAVPAA